MKRGSSTTNCMKYFTGLLRDSGVEIFGRNTYHLMYPYWHDVAVNQSETKVTNEFARTFDSIAKDCLFNDIEERGVEQHDAAPLNLREEIMKLNNSQEKIFPLVD